MSKLEIRVSFRAWFRTNCLLSFEEWTNCGTNHRVETWRCGPIIVEKIK